MVNECLSIGCAYVVERYSPPPFVYHSQALDEPVVVPRHEQSRAPIEDGPTREEDAATMAEVDLLQLELSQGRLINRRCRYTRLLSLVGTADNEEPSISYPQQRLCLVFCL